MGAGARTLFLRVSLSSSCETQATPTAKATSVNSAGTARELWGSLHPHHSLGLNSEVLVAFQ